MTSSYFFLLVYTYMLLNWKVCLVKTLNALFAVIEMLNSWHFFVEIGHYSDRYSEPCQTSKIERFARTTNGWKPLTTFSKRSIIKVWQGSQYTPTVAKMNTHWRYISECYDQRVIWKRNMNTWIKANKWRKNFNLDITEKQDRGTFRTQLNIYNGAFLQ